MYYKIFLLLSLLLYCNNASILPPWSSSPTNNFTVPKITPAEFRLAKIYGSDMVLQMTPKSAQIWGYGQPFAEIVITFNETIFATTVSNKGKWSIRLPPQPAGGPHKINIEHVPISLLESETIELERVMFGDVWICSGGSNMAQDLHATAGWQEQVTRAKQHTKLRLSQVRRLASSKQLDEGDVVREWHSTTEDVLLSYYPGLCLLYGIEMSEINPNRPIGLIEAAWGGTPIQAWSSERVFDKCSTLSHHYQNMDHIIHYYPTPSAQHQTSELHSHAGEHSRIGHHTHHNTEGFNTADALYAERRMSSDEQPTSYPFSHEHDQYSDSALWNGMIHPLTKFTVRGVIWQQGEANTAYQNEKYHCFFTNMIADWQNNFLDSDVPVPEEQNMHFPFGYVQLGPSRSERHMDWGKLRFQQSVADPLFNLPGTFLSETFMAPSYDLIDAPDVTVTGLGAHYREKARVADRLALAASQLMYDPKLIATGPVPIFTEMIVDTEHQLLNITYDKNIQVRGPDGFYFEAAEGEVTMADITNSWVNGVSLSLQEGARFVMYGWGALPCEHLRCAIYSVDPHKHGLPAVTFKVHIPYKNNSTIFNRN